MRIFCKYKDFYDYLQSHDSKDPIIFDRRNCLKVDNNFIFSKADFHSCSKKYYSYDKETEFYAIIGFRFGYTIHFFKITIVSLKYILFYSEEDKFSKLKSIEYLGSRKDYNYEGLPVDICYYKDFIFQQNGKIYKIDILKDNFTNLHERKIKYSNNIYSPKKDTLPILNKCFITSFLNEINVERCFYDIEEYLLSKNNDKSQESKGLTDVDKAINHGFDKTHSFRKT